MAHESIVWFEQKLPFRRRDGERVELPITDLTDDAAGNPIVAIETGHWFTDAGFFFLLRDLLQIAMPPADDEAWVAGLVEPPAPNAIRAALAPYAEAFDLVHPELPAMQVRPTEEALAARRKGNGKAAATSDEEEDEDDEAEAKGPHLARLLPDVPTGNNEKTNTNFFGRLGGEVPPLAAGIALPLLYADMVLFPSPGGGHFGLPAGIDTIKFAVVGDTLWRSLWANVKLGKRMPLSPEVFPWRNPHFRKRRAGKDPWFEDNPLYIAGRPHIPMPRRYLLGKPTAATCALTGVAAPCFATFERWPNGPKYAPAGFRPVWASTKDKKGDKTTANTFEYRTARGPLRFDDWLEIGIGGVVEGDDEKRWRVPDAVQRFTNNADPIADELDKRGGLDPSLVTTLKGELPFRVRAMAVVVEGKAPVASSTRELPLWRLPADVRTDLIHQVTNVVTEVGAIAKVLAEQARNCLKLADGMKAAEVGAALKDALKAMMDEAVVELPRRLVAEPDRAKTAALGDEVVAAAVDTAYRLFDESFPVTGIDKPSLAAAKARRMLRGRLNKLDPRQRGNSKQKPGKQKGKP